MLANRTADGRQIPSPEKFPDGFKVVADFIHSLGLSSGLYTAKGPHTCAGFAASCDHEVIDAAQWAAWGIDCSWSVAAAQVAPPSSSAVRRPPLPPARRRERRQLLDVRPRERHGMVGQ